MRSIVLMDPAGMVLESVEIPGLPGDALPPAPENGEWVEGVALASSHYVADPEAPTLSMRPECEVVSDVTTVVANGVDIVTFSGFTPPCTVEVNGEATHERFVEEDTTLELSFDSPGTYQVAFLSWPEKRKVIEIVAT